MLKSLNKNDTLVTPYLAVKEHHLSNIENTDLILFEHTGSDGNPIAVAIEFIDYGDGSGYPVINSSCSLANEKQSLNLASYREGIKMSGHFKMEESRNRDGTYKRLVYEQIENVFYNKYRDPIKMWGMEYIDFDKSQTKKFLQDKFVLLDIPPNIIGEKIHPNSVIITDYASDNDYIIKDDSNCNLLIGNNLFSKQQEIGSFSNHISDGHIDTCDNYFILEPPSGILNLTASQVNYSLTISLDWNYNKNDADGFIFYRSTDSGSTWNYLLTVNDGIIRNVYDTTSIDYNQTYLYKNYSYNFYGTGSWSNISVVTISSPNEWGEDWESYPTGNIFTSSNSTYVFDGIGTIRPSDYGVVARESISAYSESIVTTLDSGIGVWDGPGIII